MSTKGRGARGGATSKSPRLSQSPGAMTKFVSYGGNRNKQTVEKQSKIFRQKKTRKKIRKKLL